MKFGFWIATSTAVSLFAPRASLFAQVKQPLTFDKFIALQIAADPRPSPDGSTVAFGVSVPSLQDNRNISRVWIVPAAGGPRASNHLGPGQRFLPPMVAGRALPGIHLDPERRGPGVVGAIHGRRAVAAHHDRERRQRFLCGRPTGPRCTSSPTSSGRPRARRSTAGTAPSRLRRRCGPT